MQNPPEEESCGGSTEQPGHKHLGYFRMSKMTEPISGAIQSLSPHFISTL